MKKYKLLKSDPAFTVIELLVIVLTLSILAATSITSFRGYVARSRLAEPFLLLGKMADQQAVYFDTNGAFIETGPTNIPPTNSSVQVEFVGNWNAISFSVADAIRFGYRCYQDTGPLVFICEAQGDQNGDGNPSIIQITLDATSGTVSKSNFYIFDELE